MKETKAERRHRLITRLEKMGFSYDETQTLRRIEMTLSRWSEGECGDSNDYCSSSIERDEATGIPYRVTVPHRGEAKPRRHQIPDREKGALKRLSRLMAGHPDCVAYHQGDPRGCALYILAKSDLKPGEDINSVYTRGVAVCD